MLKAHKIAAIPAFVALTLVLIASGYAAYKGHTNERDISAVLSSYPNLKNTAADSCATCHKNGEVRDAEKPQKMRHENVCGYCHALHVKGKRDVKETLNRYGAAYLAAGRGPEAVKALAFKDSDGDGFNNETEFAKGTNPGEPASNPSAAVAPFKIYDTADIQKLSPVVNATVFLNTSHNKAGDFYNQYQGNRVYEILQAAGISNDATGVDFISMDGFEGAFSMEELKKSWPQSLPLMGLSKKEMGECGWVNYNAPGLDAKNSLPSMSIMLAFEENGKKIDAGRLDPETGKITGTGPIRLIVPQYRISPPDLPQFGDKACLDKVAPEFRFNENYDHNGGRSSFSIVAIRVHPLPKGTRDYEWEKVRNQFIAEGKLVVFGALKSKTGK